MTWINWHEIHITINVQENIQIDFIWKLSCDHLFGKLLFSWLSLVMSMMVSFVLSFFPRDVLDEILNLIESVSEDFPSYSFLPITTVVQAYRYFFSRNLYDQNCFTHARPFSGQHYLQYSLQTLFFYTCTCFIPSQLLHPIMTAINVLLW